MQEIQYEDKKVISNRCEDEFFNCKRVSNNVLQERINAIYKIVGAKEPKIKIYENPRDVDLKEGKLVLSYEDITKKLRDAWVPTLLFNENLWDDFGKNRVHITEPEVSRRKIGDLYDKIMVKYPNITKDKSMYNDNNFFFSNYVYDLGAKDPFFRTFMEFMHSGVMWFRFNEGTAHVLRTPIEIVRNNDGELHSANPNRPAVRWATGDPECFLWGVWFDHNLWEKVVNFKLTSKQCIKIENIEQRTKALLVVGYKDVIKDEYLVDTADKTVYVYKDGEYKDVKVEYKLYAVPGIYDDVRNRRNGNEIIVKLTHYKCPSTGRDYYSPVPPDTESALEGMAFKFGITVDEFKEMQIES